MGKNTIGHVIFECGCIISLKDIKKSKIGNLYKCLYHEAKIKNVIKKCLNCKTNIIPFREISQILKQDFCCKDCAVKYRIDKLKLIDENPPNKHIDCVHYEYCYGFASRNNLMDLGCETCDFFIKKTNSNISREDSIWKII